MFYVYLHPTFLTLKIKDFMSKLDSLVVWKGDFSLVVAFLHTLRRELKDQSLEFREIPKEVIIFYSGFFRTIQFLFVVFCLLFFF